MKQTISYAISCLRETMNDQERKDQTTSSFSMMISISMNVLATSNKRKKIDHTE